MKVEKADRGEKQEKEARLLHLSRCLNFFFFFCHDESMKGNEE